MMEAKDWKIFLSVPEIHEKLYDKGFTTEECEAIIYICERAGIRKVVEWIKTERKCEYFNNVLYYPVYEKALKAKIKEWGV